MCLFLGLPLCLLTQPVKADGGPPSLSAPYVAIMSIFKTHLQDSRFKKNQLETWNCQPKTEFSTNSEF